ncbi:unnamed protein product, partial [Ectocarpus sp. 12 AP-2014]
PSCGRCTPAPAGSFGCSDEGSRTVYCVGGEVYRASDCKSRGERWFALTWIGKRRGQRSTGLGNTRPNTRPNLWCARKSRQSCRISVWQFSSPSKHTHSPRDTHVKRTVV